MDDYVDMYKDFSNVAVAEEKVSPQAILEVLKDYSATISVFDLMQANAEMIEESKYVQGNLKGETIGVYAKFFLGRIKEIRDDGNNYNHDVDNEAFIDAVATLKSYYEAESKSTKTKFPLIYAIVSLYTTFVLKEPIHPVGTPFPGSLKVEEKDGVFYCPVKEANMDTPNSVCRLCIAEQLDF